MSHSLDDLLHLMKRLRDPETGCPWDVAQTSADIVNYSIEEVYELADAIENHGTEEIRAELGDLLFQVIFLSRIAEERSEFGFGDVVSGLIEKLVQRHPHVFTDGDLYGSPRQGDVRSDEVNRSWEKIKQQERQSRQETGLFADVPLALPALRRAAKLQKRAVPLGLDWSCSIDIVDKLKEELDELERALEYERSGSGNVETVAEEVGDLLFSCVNIARKQGIDAEQALRKSSDKFVQRVLLVERMIAEQGASGETLSEQEIDQLWVRAKNELAPS